MGELVAFKAMAKSLLDSDTLSDFTVICAGRNFKVHKMLLMCHSVYFKTLFLSGFSEALKGEVDLKDDPPYAVEVMIHYFYRFDYSIEERGASPCQSHSEIYAIADKYQVDDLKELARLKFATALFQGKRYVQFAAIHVFQSTPDTDDGLRDICLLAYAIFIYAEDANEPIVKALTDLTHCCKQVMRRVPDLAVEIAAFGLFRQTDRLTVAEKSTKSKGSSICVMDDLFMYLLTHRNGWSRFENLRLLVEKLGWKGWRKMRLERLARNDRI